mmetsp:Transcript_157392/g.501683  ORF Transcript_157392/g.501683 Transcript_157392/m.501683 type:complete len:209 (-) Transcript_157392:600-1226(-)
MWHIRRICHVRAVRSQGRFIMYAGSSTVVRRGCNSPSAASRGRRQGPLAFGYWVGRQYLERRGWSGTTILWNCLDDFELEHGVPIAAQVASEELQHFTKAVPRTSARWAELLFVGQAVSFALCWSTGLRHSIVCRSRPPPGYHRETSASSAIQRRTCSTALRGAPNSTGIERATCATFSWESSCQGAMRTVESMGQTTVAFSSPSSPS